jgi:ABC-type phosphate transport system substrate-binding protein
MRARRALILALVFVASFAAMGARATSPPAYVVIVDPANPTTSVPRRFLADAFLKKTTRWDNGETIRPVDQPPDSSVRRRFSDEVLKRSVAAVRNYWQQIIFAGRGVPPPELDSDEEVVKYVTDHAGAVGYVSGSNTGGAKILTVD